MGDYCDFVNMRDPRFDPATLADWVNVMDLTDLARAQRDRFLDIVSPIAHKCLALIEGNHETAIKRHYERAIYAEIVTAIKEKGKFEADATLGLGFYGWLVLCFYGTKTRKNANVVKMNLHHGFVGGRLAGAKALNMQRWLWSHDCDIAVFGHSHNQMIQVESVERLNRTGTKVEHRRKVGCYAGSFLKSVIEDVSTYSEQKGYFPLPVGHVEIVLQPHTRALERRIRVMSG